MADNKVLKKKGSLVSGFTAFFSSLKLTIFLLITLALVSIIGTVIPQNMLRADYLKIYKESTYTILKAIGFLDMYHSWWFVLIMTLLTINLIACSWKHFPRTWRFFSHPTRLLDKTLEKASVPALVGRRSWELLPEDPASLLPRLEGLWPGRWQWLEHAGEAGPELHYAAEKGRWSRLGVYFVHLSILIIFAGGIIGSLFGVKGYVNIPEGEKISTFFTYGDQQTSIDLGFSVECRDFEVEFYESGGPKEYSSDLIIYDNGKPVKEKIIEVNHPISYQGFTFYQSSYGAYGGLVDLELNFRQTGLVLPLKLEVGRPLRLPENWGWIEVLTFEENSMRMGPAVKVLRDPGKGVKPYQFWVFLRFPKFGEENRKTSEFCVFKNIEQLYYTGLQVNKDPGVWVVWIGCIMMILGLYVAFFMSHRRLWLRLAPNPDKPERLQLVLVGNANKNQPSFELEFKAFAEKVKVWD
ncbi:MAG: cytochrome c biogenesis protein ResB [Deltaproteobacteria bacterium]|nr:cytochrome c biogenesis protein ResB [Deltaproteobacteria bacterium]